MSDAIATTDNATLLEQVVVGGDLSRLTPADRLQYYKAVCESVGLNPLTRPFDYLTLSGRLVLYAKKDATDQLRKIHGVSITGLENKMMPGDLYVVTASAKDRDGRVDAATGAVYIGKAIGEVAANLLMKAETKAKRRVTLSLCGLGMLDESEIDSIQGAVVGEPSPTMTVPYQNVTVEQHVEAMKRQDQEQTELLNTPPTVRLEDEERHTLSSELFKHFRDKKMGSEEQRKFAKRHSCTDIFAADLATLKAMLEEMKSITGPYREPQARA
jgi:hypothetical protein